MPKCPKCQAEINHLIDWEKCWYPHEFTLLKDGATPDWNTSKLEPESIGADDYDCPECLATLFSSEKKAIAFLKGK